MNIKPILERLAPWAFLLPMLVAAAYIIPKFSVPGVAADSIQYLQVSRSIQYGHGLGWTALWTPPIYSILTAGVAALFTSGNLLAASGVVSAAMGILLPGAVYLLAVQIFSKRVALVAGVIVATFPHILKVSSACDSEITYLAFLYTALALQVRASKSASWLYSGLAGVAFALAWMGRSEALLIMLMTTACLVISMGKKMMKSEHLKVWIVLILAFCFAASPYLMFLKKHYGALVLSPRATYVLIWMKGATYHDHDKGEIGNDELWGLTPDGKYRWNVPTGVGDVISYLASHPKKSLEVYLHNLSREIPGRIPNNSGTLHYPQVYPVYIALLALFAAFRRWEPDSSIYKCILLPPFLILLILPVYTDGWWKYLLANNPLLIILASAGFVWIAGMINRTSENGKICRENIIIGVVAISLVCYYSAINLGMNSTVNAGNKTVSARLDYANELIKAGEWGARQYGPGKNYLIPWSKMVYHLNGIWTALPVAGDLEIYQFALKHNIDYYVLENIPQGYPDELFARFPPYGFVLDSIYHSDTSDFRVAFYRLYGRQRATQ